MIRAAQKNDIERIMQIWLESNIKAHNFIDKSFWEERFAEVRDVYLPQSETFVYEDKHQIKGFVSLILDNFIGALFVDTSYQRQNIGTKLLEYIRRTHPSLTLRVYTKNQGALSFYQFHGFKILAQKKDENTGAEELIMSWALGCKSGYNKRFPSDS